MLRTPVFSRILRMCVRIVEIAVPWSSAMRRGEWPLHSAASTALSAIVIPCSRAKNCTLSGPQTSCRPKISSAQGAPGKSSSACTGAKASEVCSPPMSNDSSERRPDCACSSARSKAAVSRSHAGCTQPLDNRHGRPRTQARRAERFA